MVTNWVWVDTCCIDKTNSVELSEAINSMLQWDAQAQKCYALIDCEKEDDIDIFDQRWFTRGWMIAPADCEYWGCLYKSTGTISWPIGSRERLALQTFTTTGIPYSLLRHRAIGTNRGQLRVDLMRASVAQRMSWAARRITTRSEDIAYSLLGIFDVNMPLLYGEGEKAFIRLQQQICQQSSDESIFAWTSQSYNQRQAVADDSRERSVQHILRRITQTLTSSDDDDAHSDSGSDDDETLVEAPPDHDIHSGRGIFAQTPLEFFDAGDIHPVNFRPRRPPFHATSQGLSMHYMPISVSRHLRVFVKTLVPTFLYRSRAEDEVILGLECERTTNDPRFGKGIAIVLAKLPDGSYFRQQSSTLQYYRHRRGFIETLFLGGWSRLYITTQIYPPTLINNRPKQKPSGKAYSEDIFVMFFVAWSTSMLGKLMSQPVANICSFAVLWASSTASWKWSDRWFKYQFTVCMLAVANVVGMLERLEKPGRGEFMLNVRSAEWSTWAVVGTVVAVFVNWIVSQTERRRRSYI